MIFRDVSLSRRQRTYLILWYRLCYKLEDGSPSTMRRRCLISKTIYAADVPLWIHNPRNSFGKLAKFSGSCPLRETNCSLPSRRMVCHYRHGLSIDTLHNERDGVLNHRRIDCLLNRFKHRSKKTPKLRITGLCDRSPVDSNYKGPITWKMFPFDDVIMEKWGNCKLNQII